MTAPWLYAGVPDPRAEGEVVLMEGTTFCIGDTRGDVGGQQPSGLFVRDTRVLSGWALRLRERSLDPLRVHQEAPYAATFVLFSPGGPGRADLVVTRERFVGDGLREEITVRNAGSAPVQALLDLAVAADFADLFEVKEGRPHLADGVRTRAGSRSLELCLERGGAEYAVRVEPAPGATVDRDGLHWRVDLAGHATWRTTVLVVPRLRGEWLAPLHAVGAPAEHAEPARRRRQFRTDVPGLSTADPDLADVLEQSIEDLGVLRIFDPDRPDLPVIAAGAPWFMALFGRDSLLTSTMLLPVDSRLALGTLTTLAAHAGTTEDPVTEEQPGRIPHEVRFGPAGTLALGGRNAYYGSADATPLYVVTLGELFRWQPDLVGPELVAAADRALAWMEDHGDADGDGFIEYHRATDSGLANQGWKDSWDGVNHADGAIARSPIALAEVQAYAYAAYLARAEIAEAAAEVDRAAAWRTRADRLRSAFNEAFWLPDRGWYAVGLDGDKRPIDALTSNIGHCLWTGIADEDKAAEVVRHLLSPAMSTGWGIRTLASGMGAYNPMSYHNGSVWPHDTAICVAGIARYGYTAEAAEVALGLLDAAASFQNRLPELFAGFARSEIPVPVPYPAACSPQAWAAAAPVQLLRTLLGLEPSGDRLECAPAVPGRLLPLQVRHVPFRGRRFDIDVDHRGWQVTPEQ